MNETNSKQQNGLIRFSGAWLFSFVVPFLVALAIISIVEHQKLVSDSGKSEVLGVVQSDMELWVSAANFSLLFAVPIGLIGVAAFAVFVVVSRHRKRR